MNKARRKELEKARELLCQAETYVEEAKQIIETALEEEQDYYNNMPESMQRGDKGQRAEAAVEALERVLEGLQGWDEFTDALTEAME